MDEFTLALKNAYESKQIDPSAVAQLRKAQPSDRMAVLKSLYGQKLIDGGAIGSLKGAISNELVLEPVNIAADPRRADPSAHIMSLDPTTKQGILELQSIKNGETSIVDPQLRQMASDKFYSRVPIRAESVSFNDPENPKKPTYETKGFGRQAQEAVFSRDAVERSDYDQGGAWEGVKSAVDYGVGALGGLTRGLGAFTGAGPITDESTYAFNFVPEYEGGLIEVDTPMGKTRENITQGLVNNVGVLYKKEIAQSDPDKRMKLKEYRIQAQAELASQMDNKSYLETIQELGSQIASDPTALLSVAGQGIRQGAKTIRRMGASSDEALDAIKNLEADRLKVTYGEPELVEELSPVVTQLDGGKIALAPAKAEQVASTLVRPPTQFDDVSKQARKTRFEALNVKEAVDDTLLDIDEGIEIIADNSGVKGVNFKQMAEDAVADTQLGEVVTKGVETLTTGFRSANDLVTTLFTEIKGITRPRWVKPTNAVSWDYVKNTDEGAEFYARFNANNLGADKQDINNFLKSIRSQARESIEESAEIAQTKNFNRTEINVVKKLALRIDDVQKSAKEGKLSITEMNTIIKDINKTTKGINPAISPNLADFDKLAKDLTKLKNDMAKDMADLIPAKYIKAPEVSAGSYTSYFTGEDGVAKPFKAAYEALRKDVRDITEFSQRILDQLKIKQVSGLTEGQYDDITKKVNAHLSKILKPTPTNTSEAKFIKKALGDLETYLNSKGIKSANVGKSIEEFRELTKNATPLFDKGGKLSGFKLGTDDVLDSIGATFKKDKINGLIKLATKIMSGTVTTGANLSKGASLKTIETAEAVAKVIKPDVVEKLVKQTGMDATTIRRVLRHVISKGVRATRDLNRREDRNKAAASTESIDMPTDFSLSGSK